MASRRLRSVVSRTTAMITSRSYQRAVFRETSMANVLPSTGLRAVICRRKCPFVLRSS